MAVLEEVGRWWAAAAERTEWFEVWICGEDTSVLLFVRFQVGYSFFNFAFLPGGFFETVPDEEKRSEERENRCYQNQP